MFPPELSLAAFAVAGLGASPHCALMCGCLQATQLQPGNGSSLQRSLLLMHAGRIAGYALLGAVICSGGLLLFRHLPDATLGLPLQGLAALILLLTGLQQLRGGRGGCHARRPGRPSPRPFARGLAWALMPCGALYGMLFIAMLSRSPGYAALLMAAFGLGTVPLLGAGSLLARPAAAGNRHMRQAGAALLVVLGTAGLVAVGMASTSPVALCAVAR